MIKLFNKWESENVKVDDPGIQRYINLDPIMVPKTGGRNIKIKFHKSKYNIVERLINKIMVSGHKGKKHFISNSGRNTGKAINAYNIVKKTLEIIEKKMNDNPIKILVKAIENASPREEIISIEYGGARYPQAVEVAPQRRIDIALRYMAQGARQKCFNKKVKMYETLADEIINAYGVSNKSTAIMKKLELERQADAAR
jgi:small subunit ribosomal protein S7